MQHATTLERLRPGSWFILVDTDGLPKGKPVPIKSITVRPPGCRNSVHINDSHCYNAAQPVISASPR